MFIDSSLSTAIDALGLDLRCEDIDKKNKLPCTICCWLCNLADFI